MKRILSFLLVLLMIVSAAAADSGITITIIHEDGTEQVLKSINESEEPAEALDESLQESEGMPSAVTHEKDSGARESFIDDIISVAKKTYEQTGGRAQRAQYSGDIYICKNFTVYCFRQNCDHYRMAAFPDIPLIIPDNKPKNECTNPVYGALWKDVPAENGNPFEMVDTFKYDDSLSKEQNRERARELLKKVQRGDYFQMAAKYYYGTGAHSLIFIADYDEESDTVHWCDSNMKGEKRDGIRYGYVQFDAVKEIDWFVDAFCRKKYGATLYRLRNDIIYAE